MMANVNGPLLDFSSEAGSLMTLRPAVGVTPYRFDTAAAHAVSNLVEVANNGTNQITFGPLASIGFGHGGTNKLFLDTSNKLEYTNNAPVLQFKRPATTTYLELGVSDVDTPYLTSPSYIDLIAGTLDLWFDSTQSPDAIYPQTSGAVNLGIPAKAFGQLYLTNSASTNLIYFGTNTLSVQGSDLYWNQTKLN